MNLLLLKRSPWKEDNMKLWIYWTHTSFQKDTSSPSRFWFIYSTLKVIIFLNSWQEINGTLKGQKDHLHLIHNNTHCLSHSSIFWVLIQSNTNTHSTNFPLAEITARRQCHINSYLSILNITENHFLLALSLENNANHLRQFYATDNLY